MINARDEARKEGMEASLLERQAVELRRRAAEAERDAETRRCLQARWNDIAQRQEGDIVRAAGFDPAVPAPSLLFLEAAE